MVESTAGAQAVGTPPLHRPYPPSLFDRLLDWVDSLPGPALAYYVALFLLLAGTNVAIQWSAGNTDFYAMWVFLMAFNIPYNLYFMHLLNKLALRALDRFQPLLDCPPDELEQLRYRLSTMPLFASLMAAGVGALIATAFIVSLPLDLRLSILRLAPTDASIHYNQISVIVTMAFASVYTYYVRVKIHVMRQILGHYTQIDLFNQGPIYTFAQVSALTAISIIIIVYIWLLVLPAQMLQVGNLMTVGFLLVISALTFVLPLISVHNVLVREKLRMTADNIRNVEAVTAELHRRVEGGPLTDMDNVYKALNSLEVEAQAIRRVPTWPWQPETARLVIVALLLPVVLWLLQRFLTRFLVT